MAAMPRFTNMMLLMPRSSCWPICRNSLITFAVFPEVLECHVILGAYDFLLRVVVRDMEAYEKFYFGKLSTVPDICEVNSFVAAWEVKSTTSLPLKV